MKKFINGVIEGLSRTGLIIGGAIGGSTFTRGFYVEDSKSIIIGVICIVVNLSVALLKKE